MTHHKNHLLIRKTHKIKASSMIKIYSKRQTLPLHKVIGFRVIKIPETYILL